MSSQASEHLKKTKFSRQIFSDTETRKNFDSQEIAEETRVFRKFGGRIEKINSGVSGNPLPTYKKIPNKKPPKTRASKKLKRDATKVKDRNRKRNYRRDEERREIVLKEKEGRVNMSQMAKIVGIDRATLSHHMDKLSWIKVGNSHMILESEIELCLQLVAESKSRGEANRLRRSVTRCDG